MFENTKAFSGFSVNDIPRAKEFYGETLGLEVSEENGMLTLHIAGDRPVLVYPKEDHAPASFTILNFPWTTSRPPWTISSTAACSSSTTEAPRSRPTRRGSSAAADR